MSARFTVVLALSAVLAGSVSLAHAARNAGQDTPGPDSAEADVPAVDDSSVEYAQQAFDELKARSQYGEAIAWGERVLERLGGDPDDVRMGNAHLQLAAAYHEHGDLDRAIMNYEIAVRHYQFGLGRDHEALIKPYWSLARAYGGVGDYKAAVKAYKKTTQVQRVNLGVNTDEQIEPLLEMSEVHFAMEEFDRADGVQRNYIRLLSRQYPGEPMKALPAHYSRAGMLARMGRSRKAIENYRRIIRIVENEKGGDALEMLPALQELAQVHYWRHMIEVGDRDQDPTIGSNTKKPRQDLVSGRSASSVNVMIEKEDDLSKAYRTLRRAIKLTEKNENATNLEKADALIAMGDLLIVKTTDYVSVERYYREAWEFLSEDDALQDELDERFAVTRALNDSVVVRPSGMTSMFTRQARRGSHSGVVRATFDVTRKGRPVNIRIVESTPEGFKDRTVRNYLRGLIYRPQIVDGKLAGRNGNRFEIEYVYEADELPAELRHTLSRLR